VITITFTGYDSLSLPAGQEDHTAQWYKLLSMSKFAFFGGFTAVALGITGYYVTGTWEILLCGCLGLFVILILLAAGGNKKALPVAGKGKAEKRRK
jgi:hypothetical protein